MAARKCHRLGQAHVHRRNTIRHLAARRAAILEPRQSLVPKHHANVRQSPKSLRWSKQNSEMKVREASPAAAACSRPSEHSFSDADASELLRGLLLCDERLAASMCIIRTAFDVMTALRMALSMLGL